MFKKMRVPLPWVSRLIMGYMLLAFFWWAVQLWQENNRSFKLEHDLLELWFTRKNQGLNETQFLQTTEYQTIEKRLVRHKRMIIAEGLFFAACLVFGIFAINRSVNREIALTRQRRNFMLSITHELKSPIASLRLVLETILKRDLQRDQLEKLSSNGIKDAVRLQNLVESLLLAARLEDNWRPAFESVDLEAIARACVTGLQVRFPDAQFTIQTDSDLPKVQADKSAITSVIQNLLENAAKYNAGDAQIHFSATALERGRVRFIVSDNGKGIPEHEKKAVFEKFYRIGNEETRQSTGTGLGLYIVQQVVRAHRGTLTLSDNKPVGTIFTIEI
jgi:signal transduction histidine kinase